MTHQLGALGASRRAVHIRTKHPDGSTFLGIILEDKESFIIIQNITSFEYDGTVVIPKKWVNEILDGKVEQVATEILSRFAAPADTPPAAPHFGRDSLKDIVKHLQMEGIWPAVESIQGDDSSLYIGPIIRTGSDSFEVHCYNAAGEWESKYIVGYDELFKIEIDSKYVRYFNEYMKAKRAT
jgi:hypothetical protein